MGHERREGWDEDVESSMGRDKEMSTGEGVQCVTE